MHAYHDAYDVDDDNNDDDSHNDQYLVLYVTCLLV